MARLLRKDSWVDLNLPGRKSSEIVSSKTGSKNATLRYVEIPVPAEGQTSRAMHLHRSVEEVIYVLSGEGVFETPDEKLAVHAGDVVVVPGDQPHVTRNVSNVVLRLMCFFPHPDIAAVTVNLLQE